MIDQVAASAGASFSRLIIPAFPFNFFDIKVAPGADRHP